MAGEEKHCQRNNYMSRKKKEPNTEWRARVTPHILTKHILRANIS